ncbi:MAG TPA: PilZ domain-containing protein [Planctomycetota bacterium]|nr:PilZ domain-containing protein [Planctomycetota bacterium]
MSINPGLPSYGLPGAVRVDPSVYTQGLSMLKLQERRAARREQMSETILFRRTTPGTSRRFLSGYLRDISSGGVSFETEARLQAGEVIDVFFKRQLAYTDTCARAEVVRTASLGARLEVGAKFV